MDSPKKHLTYGRWCASGSVKSSKGKVYPLSWSVSKICHDLVSKLNLVTHSWPGYYHMTCLKGDLCHTSKSGGGAKTGSLQLLKNYWNSSKWLNFHEKYLNFDKMKKTWNIIEMWISHEIWIRWRTDMEYLGNTCYIKHYLMLYYSANQVE